MRLLSTLDPITLGKICEYLSFWQLAQLYATNDRTLRSNLATRSTLPTLTCSSQPSRLEAALLRGHANASKIELGMRPRALFPRDTICYKPSSLPPRLMTLISHKHLQELYLYGRFQPDSFAAHSEGALRDQTFATLFPTLKSLVVHEEGKLESYPHDSLLQRLFTALPSRLESLHIATNAAWPSLSTLPATLTSLAILVEEVISSYALEAINARLDLESAASLEFAETTPVGASTSSSRSSSQRKRIFTIDCVPMPTWEVLKALDNFLPDLRALSVLIPEYDHVKGTSHVLQPDSILPTVTLLKVLCKPDDGVELKQILTSASNVGELVLYGITPLQSEPTRRSDLRVTENWTSMPPKLHSLTLGSVHDRFCASEHVFRAIPPTITSLSLIRITPTFGSFIADPDKEFDGIHGMFRAARSVGNQTSSSANTSNQAPTWDRNKHWMGILPASIISIKCDSIDVELNSLPPRLEELICTNAPADDESRKDYEEGVLNEDAQMNFKSVDRLPHSLRVLQVPLAPLRSEHIGKLPTALRALSCLTQGTWTQHDIARIFAQCPDCVSFSLAPLSGVTFVWNDKEREELVKRRPETAAPVERLSRKFVFLDALRAWFSPSLAIRCAQVPWLFFGPATAESVKAEEDAESFTTALERPFRDAETSDSKLPESTEILDLNCGGTYKSVNLSTQTLSQLLLSLPALREVHERSAACGPSMYESIPFKNVRALRSLQHLTTLHLHNFDLDEIPFSAYPRTLTSLVGPTSTRGIEYEPNFPSAPHDDIDELPKTITNLRIPTAAVLFDSPEKWPPALTRLYIRTQGWNDTQVASLMDTLPALTKIRLRGSIACTGTLTLPSDFVVGDYFDTSKMAGGRSRFVGALADASKLVPMNRLRSFRLQDVPAMVAYALSPARLQRVVVEETVPSLFSSEVESIEIATSEGAFKYAWNLRPSKVAFGRESFFETLDKKASNKACGTVALCMRTHLPSIVHTLSLDAPQFGHYKALSTLKLGLEPGFLSAQLNALPATLTRLALFLESSGPLVDPFTQLKCRHLKSLVVESEHSIDLTLEGLEALPRSLVELEVSALRFAPSFLGAILGAPRAISKLRFNADYQWNETHALELLTTLCAAEKVEQIKIFNVCLSGALLPDNITDVSVIKMIGETEKALGPAFQLDWKSLESPLSPSLISPTSRPQLASLDLDSACISLFSSFLPTLPSNLTRLSVRLTNALSGADLRALPSSLTELRVRYDANKSMALEPEMWSALPANLEILGIDRVLNVLDKASTDSDSVLPISTPCDVPLLKHAEREAESPKVQRRFGFSGRLRRVDFVPVVVTSIPALSTSRLHTLLLPCTALSMQALRSLGPQLTTLTVYQLEGHDSSDFESESRRLDLRVVSSRPLRLETSNAGQESAEKRTRRPGETNFFGSSPQAAFASAPLPSQLFHQATGPSPFGQFDDFSSADFGDFEASSTSNSAFSFLTLPARTAQHLASLEDPPLLVDDDDEEEMPNLGERRESDEAVVLRLLSLLRLQWRFVPQCIGKIVGEHMLGIFAHTMWGRAEGFEAKGEFSNHPSTICYMKSNFSIWLSNERER